MGFFNTTDFIFAITFIVISIIVPFLVGFIKRREGFLMRIVAGRSLKFVSVALSMFLSENGTGQFSGMAGWAVHSGLGIYAYELVGSIGLITLGWLFMPVYKASGVYTTVEYTNKRFGGKRIGFIMVILMLLINVVAKLSVELQIIHVLLAELYQVKQTDINILLLVCSFFVIIPGGLYSIVYTSNAQFIFFSVGIPVIFVSSYNKFISWQEIQMRYQKAWPNTTVEHIRTRDHSKYTHCGMPDIHSLDIIRIHTDKDLPWPGMIFGIYIISVYQFCIDQSILQFCLGAKDIVSAKYACVISAFFKVTTIFLVIPGFIARILYTDLVACAEPEICEVACNKRSGCADLAIPMLFRHHVPHGWHGPTLVAFIIATLTSLAATLHAGSTIFVQDLYRPLRGNVTELECTVVSKVVEFLQAVIGMSIVSEINKIPAIHDFVRQIYSTMAPPLVSVYFMGIFWKKVTEDIAFRTLVFGSIVAIIRLSSKLSYGFVPCGEESDKHVPDIINNFHDLHFAIFLFVLCTCYIAICAVKQDPIDDIHLHRLLYWTRFDEHKRTDINAVIYGSNSNDQRDSSASDDDNKNGNGCFAFSRNFVRDHKQENEDNAIKSVKEKMKQSQNLNAILALLLMIIAFMMGFFK